MLLDLSKGDRIEPMERGMRKLGISLNNECIWEYPNLLMKREAKSKYIIHDELFSQLCVNYPENILLLLKLLP